MTTSNAPREGTKDRIKFDLLTRPQGATLDELNRATGHQAFSYVNDTRRLAARCGGQPRWNGSGGTRRFWITLSEGDAQPAASKPTSHDQAKQNSEPHRGSIPPIHDRTGPTMPSIHIPAARVQQ